MASWAGGTGGRPLGLSAYGVVASSPWNASENSTWRCWRRKMNNLARWIRRMIVASWGLRATGGCHGCGRMGTSSLSLHSEPQQTTSLRR